MAVLGTIALGGLGVVLIESGASKLRRGHRALGSLELAIGVLALTGPALPAASVVAVIFAGFAAVHVQQLGTKGVDSDCGCLSDSRPVAHRRALALTLGGALCAALAALGTAPTLLTLLIRDVPAGLGAAAGSLLVALAWAAAFRARPGALGRAGERLIDSSGQFLEQRVSRRDALIRVATVGSALVVAPLRFLLYPVSALAAIVPGDCSSGLCTDGYTAFCCEINRGSNSCPEGTFAGGWWKCTDYAGRRLCSDQGVRYYVDCNRIPGTHFPGGCHCANDSCANRRVACNVFRYGQCNPQVHGVTEVVCRMIVCQNPASIPHLNCNSSLAVDNAVCGHDVPCLEPPAVELVGAGGV